MIQWVQLTPTALSTRSGAIQREPDEAQREYRFNYGKAKPNRFVAAMKGNTVAVVLDPDVASVFQTSEAVNTLLRSVISALPHSIESPSK